MPSRARGPSPSPTGQDYLVSVSDLMSGLLFVFIITLAVFALRLAKLQEDTERVQRELTDSDIVRKTIVDEINGALQRAGVDVTGDTEHGIVRLTNATVGFARNEAEPLPEHRQNVDKIADVLLRVLRCYVVGPDREPAGCRSDRGGSRVGTVMLEGHTDSVPIEPGAKRYQDNLALSSARSATVFRMMTVHRPGLKELRNAEGKPVLSVSGYGATRPLYEENTEAAENRRIEIRLLMELPQQSEPQPVGEIRRELDP